MQKTEDSTGEFSFYELPLVCLLAKHCLSSVSSSALFHVMDISTLLASSFQDHSMMLSLTLIHFVLLVGLGFYCVISFGKR